MDPTGVTAVDPTGAVAVDYVGVNTTVSEPTGSAGVTATVTAGVTAVDPTGARFGARIGARAAARRRRVCSTIYCSTRPVGEGSEVRAEIPSVHVVATSSVTGL